MNDTARCSNERCSSFDERKINKCKACDGPIILRCESYMPELENNKEKEEITADLSIIPFENILYIEDDSGINPKGEKVPVIHVHFKESSRVYVAHQKEALELHKKYLQYRAKLIN